MLIRVYYDWHVSLVEEDIAREEILNQMLNSCYAYKMYLHRQFKKSYQIGADLYTMQLNFIKIIRKLPYCGPSQYDQFSPSELEDEIQQLKLVANAPWLRAKIEALKRR